MGFTLRSTARRGRASVPATRRRMRLCARRRIMFFESRGMTMNLLLTAGAARLADLLAQRLAGETYALILIWIRRTQRAHVRRYLSHHLFIRPAQHQVGLFVDLTIHSRRQVVLDRMRVT